MLDFDLTYETLKPLIPEYCPVFNANFKWTPGKKGRGNPNKPSIDRINSAKGYTLDNIIVVSWRANDLKADGTPEKPMKLAKYYSQFG